MSLAPYSVGGRWRERLHHLLVRWLHHVAQAVAWRKGHVGQLSLHSEPWAKGLPRSPTEALRWYQAAAEQGTAVAQHNLARMYMEGAGVEKDLTEVARSCRKAAEQVLANAQCNPAWMYANGVGVEKSDAEALHWYRAAAEQGHAIAQRELPAYLAYCDQYGD